MSIDIVRAGHPDCDRVAKLFDAYRHYYGQASDFDRASHFIGQRLAREESVILLATQSGNAVGFVQLYPSFSSVRTSKLWILNDLFVDPGARRKGVARALLLAARDFAIQSDACGMILETMLDNTQAQALYRELGWELDGTLHFQLPLAAKA